MPKIIPTEELTAIAAVIAAHPDGIGADGIRDALHFELIARTLQRRLAVLLDEGRINAQGTGRGKRYFPVAPKPLYTQTPDVSYESREHSRGAEYVQNLVRRPLSDRQIVTYQPTFLESYEPNQTAYLNDQVRAELMEVGQIEENQMPAGTYLRQIMDRLLIDLSWNSSRLEGNTYSLLDTQLLIEAGENAEGKGIEETQMILNHKAAIEMLAEQADEIGFNRYTICNLHALLAENLLPDPDAIGMIRSRPIGITGTSYRPLSVPQKVEHYFDMMLEKAEAIENPFEQSFFIMVQLPYLQPFEDVNKRTSRLAANIPLTRHNLCPLSFTDVDPEEYVRATLGVYELNRIDLLRDVFVWAYRRSCARHSAIRQALGKPDPFRLQYRDQIKQFVQRAVNQRLDKRTAAKWIDAQARKEIPAADQGRFIEVVERELCALREGNIARYRLRPSDFRDWYSRWN
jgi:Fic family protein